MYYGDLGAVPVAPPGGALAPRPPGDAIGQKPLRFVSRSWYQRTSRRKPTVIKPSSNVLVTSLQYLDKLESRNV
eukprot:5740050-Pleurochrysis_carterae.AAC.2